MNALAGDGGHKPAAGEDGEHQPDGGIEARARRMGWRPEEEYRGPKDKWLPADEFVETAETNFPVLRDRVRRLDDDLAKRDRKVGDLETRLAEVTQVLGEFSEHNRTLAERTYARARKDIIDEMRIATREGDVAVFDAAAGKLEELDKTAPAPPPKKPVIEEPPPRKDVEPPRISTTAKQWIDDPANDWFHKNARLNAYATAAHGENMRKGMSEAESLVAVSDDVRETFPREFENEARRAPGAVGAPRGGPPLPRKKGKTFEDLPPRAQKECDRFVKTIPKYTRDKYLADYDWSAPDDEQE